MAKKTLEQALKERRNDPRALRATLLLNSDNPLIVLGTVGEHQRVSFKVIGDKIEPFDVPKDDKPSKKEDDADKSTANKSNLNPDGAKIEVDVNGTERTKGTPGNAKNGSGDNPGKTNDEKTK